MTSAISWLVGAFAFGSHQVVGTQQHVHGGGRTGLQIWARSSKHSFSSAGHVLTRYYHCHDSSFVSLSSFLSLLVRCKHWTGPAACILYSQLLALLTLFSVSMGRRKQHPRA